jgi:hypothetical protein
MPILLKKYQQNARRDIKINFGQAGKVWTLRWSKHYNRVGSRSVFGDVLVEDFEVEVLSGVFH